MFSSFFFFLFFIFKLYCNQKPTREVTTTPAPPNTMPIYITRSVAGKTKRSRAMSPTTRAHVKETARKLFAVEEEEDEPQRVIYSLKQTTALWLHGVGVVVTVAGIVEPGMTVAYTTDGELRSARLERKAGTVHSEGFKATYGTAFLESWSVESE